MKGKENVFQEDKKPKPDIRGEREKERRKSASNFLLRLECRVCQEGAVTPANIFLW